MLTPVTFLRFWLIGIIAWLALGLVAPLQGDDDGPQPFVIRLVDEQTGRGVPLVELTTVNNIRFVTDSNGLVAVTDADLVGEKVFFQVRSHGYEYPADGFGVRGKAFQVTPGERETLRLKRVNVAERLYRVTGGGIYRDTLLAGEKPPIKQPLSNAQVVGCDSTLAVVYKGKVRWFWGDTNRPGYPLGNFHMTGAVSLLPKQGGLDPSVGIDFDYFQADSGFVRPVAAMPGDGPTWLGAVSVVDDAEEQRLVATYVKIRNGLEAYRWGMVVWDDTKNEFRHHKTFPGVPPTEHGQDHSFRHTEEGVTYLYLCNPLPLVRVKADLDSFADPDGWERHTCLKQGTKLADRQVDRDAQGRLRYSWKTNTPLVLQKEQTELARAGVIRSDEALIQLQDAATGREVVATRGSVYWNRHRSRWVAVFGELGGSSSMLGEIWYAEADSPTGPWRYARKIVTHDNYSFYNPKQQPFFDQDGGRRIYFEGTYTHTFSGNPDQTPRYDYNQIMYRLDLDDARLNLPVAVYQKLGKEAAQWVTNQAEGQPAFFALEKPGEGTIAVTQELTGANHHRLKANGDNTSSADDEAKPLFYALRADLAEAPSTTLPLYEYRHTDGRFHYTTKPDWKADGFTRAGQPICRVWRAASQPD